MLGAVTGDIIGSRFEHTPNKNKDFELFTPENHFTDDTVMTLAAAQSCLEADLNNETDFKDKLIRNMHLLGMEYPNAGYGGSFYRWIMHGFTKPYNSFGNGSAMRIAPIGWMAGSLDESGKLAQWAAEITHNHPEGIKGAQAVSDAIFLARNNASKDEIRRHIEEHYYALDFALDDIRPAYKFDVTCQGSVPQAIKCFLESTDFEDSIRNAVSLGGDADTQAAIAGSIAEAYYGIPTEILENAMSYLDEILTDICEEWCMKMISLTITDL